MGAILSSEFTEAISDIIEYCGDMDMRKSFIESAEPEYHKWKSVLYLRSCLGNTDISYEEAMQLLKTDMKDNVMTSIGEGMGWEEATEGEMSSNLYQLWIV